MNVETIISLCGTGLMALAWIVYGLVQFFRVGGFKKCKELVKGYMTEAEKLYPASGQGAEKKQWVLEQTEAWYKENCGINFTLIKSLVSKFIDDLVEGSKLNINKTTSENKSDE